MSKTTLLILCVCMVFTATAMGEPVNEPLSGDADLQLQRQRIDIVRKETLAELAKQDAACLSRFAVTDCQSKVDVRRREALVQLKRQETRINDADRRQKGMEQIQSNQKKAADRALREIEKQAAHDGNTAQERRKALDEKIINHKMPNKLPATKPEPGLDALSIEKNREIYAEKQRASEQRRMDREQRLLDKGSSSKPLPLAP